MNTQPILLACTDGSVYADSVCDHAAWAAKQLNAQVHVLHILPPFSDPTGLHNFSGAIGLDSRQTLKAELVKFEETRGRMALAQSSLILEAARERLQSAKLPDLSVEAKRGLLTEIIEQYDSALKLVVIGKRGESADFERLHLGANVERVIRSCHHPVLVASRSYRPITKALIAYDGGRSATQIIDYVATAPLLRGIRLHLLAVGKPVHDIEDRLAAAKDTLLAAGYAVETSHLNGHPEDVFAQFISDNSIDLLVMGAYGHSRIRQLIIGSTTTTMVRTSRVPVLMFR